MMARLLGEMNTNYTKQKVNVKKKKEEIKIIENQRDRQSQVNKE
jgi:hypothetical protein